MRVINTNRRMQGGREEGGGKGGKRRGRGRCRCWGPAGYDPRGEHTTPETASVWESAPAPCPLKSTCRPFLFEKPAAPKLMRNEISSRRRLLMRYYNQIRQRSYESYIVQSSPPPPPLPDNFTIRCNCSSRDDLYLRSSSLHVKKFVAAFRSNCRHSSIIGRMINNCNQPGLWFTSNRTCERSRDIEIEWYEITLFPSLHLWRIIL